jgi:hypothetical protein
VEKRGAEGPAVSFRRVAVEGAPFKPGFGLSGAVPLRVRVKGIGLSVLDQDEGFSFFRNRPPDTLDYNFPHDN